MKPGEHPEFFRFPAPGGTSRESSIRLDREGIFWHDGARVEHPKLRDALHTWIDVHPDDGRFILNNGYDWTYFTVDQTPYFVVAVGAVASGEPVSPVIPGHSEASIEQGVSLKLSDGSEVPLDVDALSEDENGVLFARIQHKGKPFEARFSRHAQTQLAPMLVEDESGQVGLRKGARVVIPPRRVSS
jgi:hypothetical protein